MTLLQPSTRLCLLFIVSCLVVLLERPLAFFGLWGLGLVLACFQRVGWRRWGWLLGGAFLAAWSMIFSQALFFAETPRTVWVTLISKQTPWLGSWTGGVFLYGEGVVYGLQQSLRVIVMLTWGALVVWTTEATALLVGLCRLRLPYSMAFLVTTALRFFPVIAEEAKIVWQARQLRGGRLWFVSPRRTGDACLSLLRALLANNVRRSSFLAEAAEGRGFRGVESRTSWHEEESSWLDRLVLSVGFLLLFALLLGKGLWLLHRQGLVSWSALRPIYDWMRWM